MNDVQTMKAKLPSKSTTKHAAPQRARSPDLSEDSELGMMRGSKFLKKGGAAQPTSFGAQRTPAYTGAYTGADSVSEEDDSSARFGKGGNKFMKKKTKPEKIPSPKLSPKSPRTPRTKKSSGEKTKRISLIQSRCIKMFLRPPYTSSAILWAVTK